MQIILKLMKKYRSFLSYAVFGVLTTVVNIVIYNTCYYSADLSNTFSNILAWVAAVAFAFVTNKLWVFESRSWKREVLRHEVPSFISCRAATGVLDLVIMYFCVDIMAWPAFLMKILSNILVIILNYVFSKLVIFKKK